MIFYRNSRTPQHLTSIHDFYGRGRGVGRLLGVGAILGVGVALGVEVGVAVDVGVGVTVTVAVGEGVGVGVPPDCAQYLAPLLKNRLCV
jgi:hypothetical protein